MWAPDAHLWYRLWSVRVAVAGAALSVASVVFPGLLGFVNPFEKPGTYCLVVVGFFLATAVSRVIDQPSLPSTPDA